MSLGARRRRGDVLHAQAVFEVATHLLLNGDVVLEQARFQPGRQDQLATAREDADR